MEERGEYVVLSEDEKRLFEIMVRPLHVEIRRLEVENKQLREHAGAAT
jgi:hypothetical protein